MIVIAGDSLIQTGDIMKSTHRIAEPCGAKHLALEARTLLAVVYIFYYGNRLMIYE